MATISKYETKSGVFYRVRYRKPDGKQTDRRGFKLKRDAEAFAATVELSKLKGEFVPASASRILVSEVAETWLALKKGTVKPATWDKLDEAWKVHVKPTWGVVQVGKVRKSEVQQWVNDTDRSATVVRRNVGVLAGILDLAIDDGYLTRHDVRAVTLPKKEKGSHAYLTWAQLEQLVNEIWRPTDRLFVMFLATTGLRFGEAVALRGRDIRDGRAYVERTMYRAENKYGVGPVKTWENRFVTIPKFVLDQMPAHMPDALVWPRPDGGMRRYLNSTSWFNMAVKRLTEDNKTFPRVTAHDLRHTAASLAVQSGANVKGVQRMLGHASAAMTLDVYADLFDSDLDEVAAKMDAAYRAA